MRLGLIAVAALCASAQADIYFEVTRAGDAADGTWDHAVFDIAGIPESPGTEWVVDALGTADPDGLLPLLASAGTLTNGGIVDASVGVLPGFPSLELPVGPAKSALIYSGFEAHNIEVGGRLFALPTAVDALPGGLNTVSIGIIQTPAPMSLAVVFCLAGVTRGRRRSTL